MTSKSFIEEWLSKLDAQAADTARQMWNAFSHDLLDWAHSLTRDVPAGEIESDCLVNSVFASLVRGVHEGRLSKVADYDELWWLLLTLTRRKVVDRIRYSTAQKRGGETSPVSIDGDGGSGIWELLDTTPTPEFIAIMEEEFAVRLSSLNDPLLARIAVLRMEGHTSQSIAEDIGKSKVTVDRKLGVIRDIWKQE